MRNTTGLFFRRNFFAEGLCLAGLVFVHDFVSLAARNGGGQSHKNRVQFGVVCKRHQT